jgi:hypothetical protein
MEKTEMFIYMVQILDFAHPVPESERVNGAPLAFPDAGTCLPRLSVIVTEDAMLF